MADFCEQCSDELFGGQYGSSDFYFTEPCENGEGYPVICEGCGYVLVDNNGVCLGGEGCEKSQGT